MLSIFSCVCWSSVCLLLKKSLFRSYDHFSVGLFFFLLLWYWVMWVLYIFWILIPYQMYNLHISSSPQYVTFSFYCCFLSLCKTLIWYSPIYLFLLLSPFLEHTDKKKNTAKINIADNILNKRIWTEKWEDYDSAYLMKFFFKICVCLAAPGLSCGTWHIFWLHHLNC